MTHRHYLHRLPQIRQLLREERYAEAEPILLGICDTMERDEKVGAVAPWYYEQLANLYRRDGRGDAERGILERYMRQAHAPGVKPPKLEARLRSLAPVMRERMAPRYVTDADGVIYRVLDTRLEAGKTRYADPPASWATTRIFRPAEGWWRLHTFTPGESRVPTDEALARQLRAAGYLAREKFDPSSKTPVPGRVPFSEPR